MKPLVLLLAAAVVLSGESQGLRPKASAADYSAFAAQNGVQIAAEPLEPDHARKSFATDLSTSYIVVEVAVYPGNVPVKLRNIDFELRLNGYATTIRPVSAEAIASNLSRPAKASSSSTGAPVTIYPSAEIGYESGGYGVDGRRHSGMVYGTGVGVGVGSNGRNMPPPPATRERNRSTMETELTDKGLPEGQITGPVAGYLYFPIPSNRKKYTVASLDYLGDNATVNVVFPAARKH